MRETTADYLIKRIDASAGWDACWPWLLSINSAGYGNAYSRGEYCSAHRLVWIHLFGDPGELTVDHRCHNRICCNPMHMRLLPNVENATDNGQITKTHCPRQHEYAGENLYVDPKGHRRCRECAREYKRARAA